MKVRFGIIGLGCISTRFASVLNTVEGVELTAVASSDAQRSEKFANKFNSKRFYKGYQAIVEDSEVDVIYIGLTHNFHYDVIKLCLEHGKGVLCEKPLVLNKMDAENLAALSKEKNVLLMEAMWSRFLPPFIKAKEWINEGKIGAVKLINASFCFNFPFDAKHRLYNPELAGGSLYDTGVYPIEFATGILGEDPTEVKGVAAFCPTGVDEHVAMSLKFGSGVLANLSCGFIVKTNQDGCIYGSNGSIVVYDFLSSHKCELYDNNHQLVERFEVEFDDGFIYQILHFADLFRNGLIESDVVPHKDNIACSRIFDELMRQWGKS